MSDTVGFVRDLPHGLVEAFRRRWKRWPTRPDLHVVNGSHPDPEGQISAVGAVLAEIGADKVPEVIVIDQGDAADPMVMTGCVSANRTRSSCPPRPAKTSTTCCAWSRTAAPARRRVEASCPTPAAT